MAINPTQAQSNQGTVQNSLSSKSDINPEQRLDLTIKAQGLVADGRNALKKGDLDSAQSKFSAAMDVLTSSPFSSLNYPAGEKRSGAYQQVRAETVALGKAIQLAKNPSSSKTKENKSTFIAQNKQMSRLGLGRKEGACGSSKSDPIQKASDRLDSDSAFADVDLDALLASKRQQVIAEFGDGPAVAASSERIPEEELTTEKVFDCIGVNGEAKSCKDEISGRSGLNRYLQKEYQNSDYIKKEDLKRNLRNTAPETLEIAKNDWDGWKDSVTKKKHPGIKGYASKLKEKMANGESAEVVEWEALRLADAYIRFEDLDHQHWNGLTDHVVGKNEKSNIEALLKEASHYQEPQKPRANT
ncbi:MAG: hypothetical protein H7A32_01915 [Deltaproteobacteria bacterium]|nr:hypothetical protein [Deltaproteobacteria bacterium]